MSCPDCFRGGQAFGEPKGSIVDMYGVRTYVAGPAETTKSPTTIIYYTDGFGLSLVNNKLLADAYASETGFRVLVPDVIPGGPMNLALLSLMDTVMSPVPFYNLWGQAVRVLYAIKAMVHIIPFMYYSKPSSPYSFKPSLAFARKVKADLPAGAKLGVAGFCWGGYQSVNMCSEPAIEGGSERLIDAQFCAHPSELNLPNDIIKAVTTFKVPVSIAHTKTDIALPNKYMEETEAALRQKAGDGNGENGFNYQIKYYDDVPHGFAVRARPWREDDSAAATDAKDRAVAWFKKWLR